ncbi:MAG: DUF4132 domain-containing protein [Reinekea sp.]
MVVKLLQKIIVNSDDAEGVNQIKDNNDIINGIQKLDAKSFDQLIGQAVAHKKYQIARTLISHNTELFDVLGDKVFDYLNSRHKRYLRSSYNVSELTIDIEEVKSIIGADNPRKVYNICSNFLVCVFSHNKIDILEDLKTAGVDLIENERVFNERYLELLQYGYKDNKSKRIKMASYLIDSGCRISQRDSERSLFAEVLRWESCWFPLLLVEKGIDIQAHLPDILEQMPYSIDPDFPQLLDYVLSNMDESLINHRTKNGLSVLAKSLYEYNNSAFEQAILEDERSLPLIQSDAANVIVEALNARNKEIFDKLLALPIDINAKLPDGRTAYEYAKVTKGLSRYANALKKHGGITSEELDANNGTQPSSPIELVRRYITIPHESWPEKAIELLTSFPDTTISFWADFFKVSMDANATKPSNKLTKNLSQLLQRYDSAQFIEISEDIIDLIDSNSFDVTEETPEAYGIYNHYLSDESTKIAKGICWGLAIINSSDASRLLRKTANKMYRKIYGIGMRNAKIANAAIMALSLMPGSHGIKELVTIRATTKYNPALVNINRIFNKIANDKGVTPEELASLSIPDYGMQSIGKLERSFGDCMGCIQFTALNKSELTFSHGEKTQKTVPAAIRTKFASEIKDFKATQKDLLVVMKAQAMRIENLYCKKYSLSKNDWLEQYINHPLVGYIAQHLIWHIADKDNNFSVMKIGDAFVNAYAEPMDIPDNANITLWHPIYTTPHEVSAWRQVLINQKITQPFKQAYREVYTLTDAERETSTYSNRFAGHYLKQGQFHALATQRGWKQTRGGGWDGGYDTSAEKEIKDFDTDVLFDTQGMGNVTISGIYELVKTSKLEISSADTKELEQVEPIIFSEVMRDTDLFVAVCSIGNDPQWQDESETGRDYWTANAFGDLGQVAKTRKDVLKMLLPKLKIASKAHIDGNFLVVSGGLTSYKIHLGSSNILMAPNDQYLCIVPGKEKSKNLFLPFEGDSILSLILSKAFLLADDKKIKDKTIVSQITEAIN